MTPLNEAIELLETHGSDRPESLDQEVLSRLVSFRDGFFRNIRTQNNHPVKVPAVPSRSAYILVPRPVFDHTRPEGLGVLAQPKFAFGHIPSEHKCKHCREYDLDGCPNCPGFQEY